MAWHTSVLHEKQFLKLVGAFTECASFSAHAAQGPFPTMKVANVSAPKAPLARACPTEGSSIMVEKKESASSPSLSESSLPQPSGGPLRDVPVDWEALEDAFENNAPEVHSYLHLVTGEVLRVVDGVADPQMHVRIASDPNYLRIDPVSSREQYRWMERFIPMVEETELRAKLTIAIDGKGAFRRFKDVLMTYGPDREKWFTFRSERLRTFMEAWLTAHAIHATARSGSSPPTPSRARTESRPSPTAAWLRQYRRRRRPSAHQRRKALARRRVAGAARKRAALTSRTSRMGSAHAISTRSCRSPSS